MDSSIPDQNELILTPYKPLALPLSDLKLIVSPVKQETDIYSELVRDPTPKKKLNFYDQSISETPVSYMLPSLQDSVDHISSENIKENDYYDNLNTVKKSSATFLPDYLNNTLPSKVAPKPCRCARSKCQKKYCDCFSLGYICSQLCECVECENSLMTVQHCHKKLQVRCKCEKSHCMKNYCECHKAGKKCSSQCNCLQCMNNQEKQDSEFKKGKTPSKRVKRQPIFNFVQ